MNINVTTRELTYTFKASCLWSALLRSSWLQFALVFHVLLQWRMVRNRAETFLSVFLPDSTVWFQFTFKHLQIQMCVRRGKGKKHIFLYNFAEGVALSCVQPLHWSQRHLSAGFVHMACVYLWAGNIFFCKTSVAKFPVLLKTGWIQMWPARSGSLVCRHTACGCVCVDAFDR